MKVLLHTSHQSWVEGSGVGRAIYHQKKALEKNGIEYTLNPKEDYDICHINTIFLTSFIMSLRAKARGKKVVYHAHSTKEDFCRSFIGSNLLAPLFKFWISRCYNRGDIILTPTEYSKSLLEKYHLKREIFSVSNGIDLDYFRRDEEAGKRFREKYGIKDGEKVIISAGLYIERKGITDFVELAKRLPQYKFIWFGYTNLRAVPKKIRDAVRTELPNLSFPGYISRDEMKESYSGADLFLFMSHEETEGIVLLESFAMKTPVLIRDIPIYEKWLTEGKNVYKAKTNGEFEEKITAILEGKAENLTETAYLEAEARSIENVGKRLVSCYEYALGKGPAPKAEAETVADFVK